MGLTFSWDSSKAERNSRKHAVSFEEASTVLATRSRSPFMTRIIQSMSSDS